MYSHDSTDNIRKIIRDVHRDAQNFSKRHTIITSGDSNLVGGNTIYTSGGGSSSSAIYTSSGGATSGNTVYTSGGGYTSGGTSSRDFLTHFDFIQKLQELEKALEEEKKARIRNEHLVKLICSRIGISERDLLIDNVTPYEQRNLKTESTDDYHAGIVCDVCGLENFRGYKYKCLICKDYDLCSKCFESKKISNDPTDPCISDQFGRHPVVRFDEPLILFGQQIDRRDCVNINLAYVERIFQKKLHVKVHCNICNSTPIKGVCFKCDICPNFYVCLNCYKNKKINCRSNNSLGHILIAVGTPGNEHEMKKREERNTLDDLIDSQLKMPI